MKSTVLSLVALTSFFTASAQLTLEKSYKGIGNVGIHNIENEGHKYIVIHQTQNRVELYNSNHSLWKTIHINVPTDYTFASATFASSKLFDLDNGVEIVAMFFDVSVSPAKYICQILNDDGTVIQSFPNSQYMQVQKVDGQWKAILLMHDNGDTYSDVYSLPGQLLSFKAPGTGNDAEISMFPNPMQNAATLAYKMPTGVHNGQVMVYNTAGALLRTYPVTDNFESIVIERGELPTGGYIYSLVVPGYNPVTRSVCNTLKTINKTAAPYLRGQGL